MTTLRNIERRNQGKTTECGYWSTYHELRNAGEDFVSVQCAELLQNAEYWDELLARTLVVLVAFVPFFAFGEIARVLGEGKLSELFSTNDR